MPEDSAYCSDVSSVIVIYRPDPDQLRKTIEAISGQVAHVFVVDNGSQNLPAEVLAPADTRTRLDLLRQTENRGVAAGHNVGIKAAVAEGAKFVLLLDQDTQVASDMVRRLCIAHATLEAANVPVAALGAQYRDGEDGLLSPFITVGWGRFKHLRCEDDAAVIGVDFLISSGTLLPAAALKVAGLMDECLFIDHVDTEWCFRAQSMGLRVFGVCGAMMTHALGERRRHVRFMRSRVVPMHKPFRYYYMFRNSVLLYRRSYMPWKWKFADLARCLKMAVFFGLLGDDRRACLSMMYRGAADGIKGVSGKRDGL